MRLYTHRTWRDIPAWGLWTKPYKQARVEDMRGTVMRLNGYYWPVVKINGDHKVLDPKLTLRGARKQAEQALDAVALTG